MSNALFRDMNRLMRDFEREMNRAFNYSDFAPVLGLGAGPAGPAQGLLTAPPSSSAAIVPGGQGQALSLQAPMAYGFDLDIKESDEGFHIKGDLPGLRKEDVHVQLQPDNVLCISGERKKEDVKEGHTWRRVERSYGQFMRSLQLPQNADVSKIKASMENGVLNVDIPKVPKEQMAKEGLKEIQIS